MLTWSNIFFGIFCIAVLFVVESGVISRNKSYEDKRLEQLIIVDAVYVLFNILWQVVEGKDFQYGIEINYAVNMLIRLTQLFLGVCYYRYLFFVITHKKQKNPLIFVPTIILGTLVIMNVVTGWIFEINEANNFVASSGHILYTILSYVYLIAIVGVSLVKWRMSSSSATRKRAAISSSLIIPPIVFSVAQLFLPSLMCLHCFGITISIASVFIRIQKQSISTNMYRTEVARENATRYRNTVLSNALQFMVINLTTDKVEELSIPKRPDITIDTLIQSGSISSDNYMEVVNVWTKNIVGVTPEKLDEMYNSDVIKKKYNNGEIKLVDDFRVARHSGEISWCRQEIILAKNEQTQDVIATLTVYDITAQKNHENAFEVQRAVVDGLAYGTSAYWVVDYDSGKIIDFHTESPIYFSCLEKFKGEITYYVISKILFDNLTLEYEGEIIYDMFSIETVREKLSGNKQYVVPANLHYAGVDTYQQISYTKVDLLGKKAFIMSTRDITDNVERERGLRNELSEALVKAERASEAKSSFLFNMSHDIRTPMNAILGFNDIAVKHIDDKQRALDALQKAKYSGEHMLSLINDILDMSRIESGKMQLCIDVIDVKEHIARFHDMFGLAMEQKGIDFKIIDETRTPYVFTDYLRLSQIIANLLSNAYKFTNSGGKVVFKAVEYDINEEEYIGYRLHIKDTGIGMSEDFQSRIFQSFERENSATVSGVQGTGLGLSIAKNLVELLGGTITFTSELGKGTEFIINFKGKVAPAPSNDTPVAENDDFSYENLSILVVEDNELNKEIVCELLEGEGVKVYSVSDGAQALDIIEKSPDDEFDLVLMDVQMPVMNGYEATERIRCMENKVKASLPIVAMTANAFDEDRNYALSIGMDEHIAKPIDVAKMFDVIKRLLKQRN